MPQPRAVLTPVRPPIRHPARCLQLPAALITALFAGSGLPAYSGSRLAAVAALLWGSAPAALCLTYLLQAAFEVWWKAGSRLGLLLLAPPWARIRQPGWRPFR